MRRLGKLVVLAVGVLLVGGGIAVFYYIDHFDSPGPLAADTIVFIPPGAGLEGIAERLDEAGIIADPLLFRVGVQALRSARDLQAGEYLVPAGASMRRVMDLLLSGKTVVRKLTLPEGLTSAEAAALVAEAEGMEGEVGQVPPEGSLLPETYYYGRGDSRAGMIARMQRALDETLDTLWPKRRSGLPITTRREAVILASIVEKETAVSDERPVVASVFINRLRKRMRLQSDPTVAYVLSSGSGPLGRDLTRRDLETPDPYNTYLNAGLPPGPIANPGRASLEAVLKPADTKYLFFVADGNGGHAFAETLEEHNRNVARWRKIRSQRE